MSPNVRRRHPGKAWAGMMVMLLPLVMAALACSFSPTNDQSLRETDIAIGIQSTFLAQTAAALAAPATATTAPTSTPVSQPLPATDTATLPPATPTETPTVTPTPLPEVLNLENWTISNMQASTKCKERDETPCWSGSGNNLKLVLETPITIDPTWEKPYLLFSQTYAFEVEAAITANVNGRWEILRSYPAGKSGWHEVAVDLSKYKGEEIVIQFYVGGQRWKSPEIWWKPQKLVDSNNDWSIQNIQIVPNYLP